MENDNLSAEQTYRTLLIIWFGLLVSQLMFFAVIYVAKPELFEIDLTISPLGENGLLILIFAMLAVSNLALGLFLGKTFVERGIEEQKVSLVQTAMLIGCALSESVSLLGIFLAFAFSYRYFFIWIVLGIVGMVLHFPNRDKVHAASFRKPN